jgi:Zn-dependent alcohol dehydrogenase
MRTTAAVIYQQSRRPPCSESRPLKIEQVDLESPVAGKVLVDVKGAGRGRCRPLSRRRTAPPRATNQVPLMNRGQNS